MATLTRSSITRSGLTVAYESCAGGGDVATNVDGKTLLLIKNASGGSLTVTVAAQVTTINTPVGNYEMTNKAKAVGAGEYAIMGPFEPGIFNNASGQLAITYSGVTSLTIAALAMP